MSEKIVQLNKKAYVHIEDWRNRPLQGGHPVGLQKIHEHEAPRGGSGRRPIAG